MKVAKSTKRNIGPDRDYGEDCAKTDIDGELFEIEKKNFLKNLERTEEQRDNLEKQTILQSESGAWLEERRKLLTASNFHAVCTRRDDTSCSSLVKTLLYKANLNVPSLNHGKKHEKEALLQLEEQEQVAIMPNGLFIDSEYPYFGE